MLRTILSICILGAFGLFIVALVKPVDANQFVDKALAVFVSKPVKVVAEPINLESIKAAFIEKKNENAFFPFLKANDGTSEKSSNITSLTTANIIAATNAERAKLDLPALATNEKLNASAKLKVEDMIKNQYFEHESPSGKGVSDLGTQVGYNYIIMGENLALGNFTSAQDLLTAWMNSPGHRANIVSENYHDIGVYAAEANYHGQKVWFAVQHFGTMRGVCPAISLSLKKDIDALSQDLKVQEETIHQRRSVLEDYQDRPEYAEKVAEFNKLVQIYNDTLVISQRKINQYNAQVSAFNKCLSGYQEKKV